MKFDYGRLDKRLNRSLHHLVDRGHFLQRTTKECTIRIGTNVGTEMENVGKTVGWQSLTTWGSTSLAPHSITLTVKKANHDNLPGKVDVLHLTAVLVLIVTRGSCNGKLSLLIKPLTTRMLATLCMRIQICNSSSPIDTTGSRNTWSASHISN